MVYQHLSCKAGVGTIAGGGDTAGAREKQVRGIPRRGLGFGLLRYMDQTAETLDKWKHAARAEVSFNYLGQVDQLLEGDGTFSPAVESTGPNQGPHLERHYVLEISAIVQQGQVRVSFSYSTQLHRQRSIEALRDCFLRHVSVLIEHCQSAESGGYTPSDFPDVQLSQRELDQIFKTAKTAD